jgi:hypothetical protein
MPQQVQIQQPARQLVIQQQPRISALSKKRRVPGQVTRVVGDLMVFVEVDENGPFGLVFLPDVIEDYHGETLQSLGIVVGAQLQEIVWDRETRLVELVVVAARGGAPGRAA